MTMPTSPIFSSAIIVTDRIVLDRQLQNTVAQFEQTRGVVKKIDGTSRQLKEALRGGARIVITTIQKFSTEHLAALSGPGFAHLRRHYRRGPRQPVRQERPGDERLP